MLRITIRTGCFYQKELLKPFLSQIYDCCYLHGDTFLHTFTSVAYTRPTKCLRVFFFIRTSCQSALSNIYNCFYLQCEPVYKALRLQNTALQIALLMIRMLFCEKELLYKLNCSILDVQLLLSSLCTCVTWLVLLYDPELRYNGSICSVVYIQRLTFHNQTSQTLSYKWVIVINLW